MPDRCPCPSKLPKVPLWRSTSRPTLVAVPAPRGGCLIELTKGQFAVVDECDLPLVGPYTWGARCADHGKTYWAAFTEWYVEDGQRKSRSISMHRLLAAALKHFGEFAWLNFPGAAR